MTKWLYNSRGVPVAYIERGNVFSPLGVFIGKIINNEIFNGYYKGEIDDNRIFVNKNKKYHLALNSSSPGVRNIPKRPMWKKRIKLRSELEDIEFIAKTND